MLVLPGLLYCLAPFVANRIEPRILGVPFLICYLLAVTVVTGPIVALVARFDPAYRSGAAEFVPADGAAQFIPADGAAEFVPGDEGAESVPADEDPEDRP
nr:DUF3311 domain-containing protein [Nocardia transvalensis]